MLENYLNREELFAEKKRLELFIGVILSVLILVSILQIVESEAIGRTFRSAYSFPMISAAALVMLVVFITIHHYVKGVIKREGRLILGYAWYVMAFEIAVPALWLIFASVIEKTASLLDSPIIFIFFLLLIISSLHLRFWLSAVFGFLIALFYLLFTYFVLQIYPLEFNLPEVVYYVRSFMYFLSGLCAAFVAGELRKRLMKTVNEITEKQKIDSLFIQHVSKDIVETLKRTGDFSARMDASILFLDIRDFTSKVQHLSPEEVNKFQNTFFAPIIEIVNLNQGIINQIMGDGLMATFGVPIENSQHAQNAWKTVLEIQKFLNESTDANLKKLEIGVGLHCGEVLAGNIGTKERKQFSVSGTPVIVAARLEQMNKETGTHILMSRVFYDRSKVDFNATKQMGKLKLKGMEHEIEVIGIL